METTLVAADLRTLITLAIAWKFLLHGRNRDLVQRKEEGLLIRDNYPSKAVRAPSLS